MKRSFTGVDGIYIKVRDASVKVIVDTALSEGEVHIQTQGWGGSNASASKGRLGGNSLYILYESSKRQFVNIPASDYRWSGWQAVTSSRTIISGSGPTITVRLPRGMRYRTFVFKK